MSSVSFYLNCDFCVTCRQTVPFFMSVNVIMYTVIEDFSAHSYHKMSNEIRAF